MNLARYTRIIPGHFVRIRDYVTEKDLAKHGIFINDLIPKDLEDFKKKTYLVMRLHCVHNAVKLFSQSYWWPCELLCLVLRKEPVNALNNKFNYEFDILTLTGETKHESSRLFKRNKIGRFC